MSREPIDAPKAMFVTEGEYSSYPVNAKINSETFDNDIDLPKQSLDKTFELESPYNHKRSSLHSIAPQPHMKGVIDNILWTGCSNITYNCRSTPRSTRGYRPSDLANMIKQDVLLKYGLKDDIILALNEENENKQTLANWVDDIKMLIESNGMDTVFRVLTSESEKDYLLED